MTDIGLGSPLRILLTYTNFPSVAYGDVEQQSLNYIARLRAAGFAVTGFCVTLNPPAQSCTWKELDRRWRWGDRSLLAMYERLEQALSSCDVLINSAGSNLHPEFVAKLPAFTVFSCMDDPENSHNLSRPAAAAYDLSLVGNIAEVETYRSWGVPYVEWTPMGLMPEIYDPTLTEMEILEGQRDIDLFLMLDRSYPLRKSRLDQLADAFPSGHFYGKGWSKGYLPPAQQLAFLRRAKIGPNIHNSTGPVNYRTFYLPANGVLQICDNKSHLGQIFALGEEAVGFDRIDEGIDLCRYYLAHDRERREIAARGFRRAMRDYTEIPVFSSRVACIERHRRTATYTRTHESAVTQTQASTTRGRRVIFPAVQSGIAVATFARRGYRWLGRRLSRKLRP